MSANPKLPTDLSAKRINEQHKLASQAAETAVQHAMLCGELLSEKKEALKHGEFQAWVEKHCDFSARTAQRYMQAAKSDTRDAFESLRQALGYATKPKAVEQSKRHSCAVLESPAEPPKATRVTHLEPAPVVEAAKEAHIPAKFEVVGAVMPAPIETAGEDDPPEYPHDIDEDAALDAAQIEYMASAEKALGTDAVTEIKRLTAELVAVKSTRDGYMNGKAAMTELLKAEQRKTAKQAKEIERLKAEVERLKERLAIMEQGQ